MNQQSDAPFVNSPKVGTDYKGFEALLRFGDETEADEFGNLFVNKCSLKWLDANLCAVLGVLMDKLTERLGRDDLIVKFDELVTKKMRENGFLEGKLPDKYRSKIPYRKTVSGNSRSFVDYLTSGFVGKAWGNIPAPVLKRLRQGLVELFSNAADHSGSPHVHSCGQYYQTGRLKFTVADGGIGIKANVERFKRSKMRGIDAILWALTEDNITRTGERPGGLGLKLLKEFVMQNKGKLIIVSADGYVEESYGNSPQQRRRILKRPFPGTAVTIVIYPSTVRSMETDREHISSEDVF